MVFIIMASVDSFMHHHRIKGKIKVQIESRWCISLVTVTFFSSRYSCQHSPGPGRQGWECVVLLQRKVVAALKPWQ